MDVFNNVIYQNNALKPGGSGFGNGGGIYCRYNRSNQFNNTIIGNSAEGEGGGIYVLNQANTIPVVTNTIVRDNTAPTGPEIHLAVTTGSGNTYVSDAEVTYCNVAGGWTGTGNIDAPPLFHRPTFGDFQLLPGSPGIDAGDNTVENLPEEDFVGRDRIVDGDENGTTVIDIGALEFDPNGPMPGDIDGNKAVNLVDTVLILRLLAGQDIAMGTDLANIDVNEDGVVGLEEALFTLQYQVRLP